MNAEEMQFRTVAFGGFHRGEVLDYIRNMTSRYQDELEEARDELTAAEQKLQQVNAAAPADDRIGALERQTETLEAENTALRREKDSLTEENRRLREQLAAWEPNVNSYGILRNQVGEIELDARARSAALLRQAEQQEQALYSRAEATLRRTEQQFRQVQGNADATLAHLTTELERIQGELSALSDALDQDGAALADLHVENPTGEGGTSHE